MSSVTYGNRKGRIRVQTVRKAPQTARSAEEVVRDIKRRTQPSGGDAYRERSLAIHGPVCGRCGRDFDAEHLHLLTIHHKDGNHNNNPPDGSNWENLCVYCHEDVHSRGLLADYFEGVTAVHDQAVVYRDKTAERGMSAFAEKLRKALEKNNDK